MEIKKLFDVSLQENVVQMDSKSELDEVISQAMDQKVENLDSVIEQKAGETAQAMLSSTAFKDAIEQALRGYGLILENPKPIINDDGSATIVDDKDDIDDTHGEDNATGIFQLEFNLEHVTIDEFARRTVKGVSGQYMDVIDPVPAQLDMNEPGETDEYDVTFRPEAGYTIDFIEANYWTGSVENLKAWIKDLIESGKTQASAYNNTFGVGIKLSWLPRNLKVIQFTVRAVPIEDPVDGPTDDPVES